MSDIGFSGKQLTTVVAAGNFVAGKPTRRDSKPVTSTSTGAQNGGSCTEAGGAPEWRCPDRSSVTFMIACSHTSYFRRLLRTFILRMHSWQYMKLPATSRSFVGNRNVPRKTPKWNSAFAKCFGATIPPKFSKSMKLEASKNEMAKPDEVSWQVSACNFWGIVFEGLRSHFEECSQDEAFQYRVALSDLAWEWLYCLQSLPLIVILGGIQESYSYMTTFQYI